MDLLEAMKRLTGTPVKLLIAGNGNLEGAIRRYVEKEQLQDQVELLGIVSGDDKIALLRSVDLVIRTSYHEVFPVAYLEALAHGVPVVATPVGDTEYMAKATGGIEIVPVKDPVKIAAAIERQRHHAGLDPEAVMHCQQYLQSITWASQAEKTISLFNCVLSKYSTREEA
jgi:glycosyltransferase involved in cell wall biosynthesis